MNKERKQPFWQVLVLTLVTSIASGAVAYWGASNDGKGAAAQTWATTHMLLQSHEDRLRFLETRHTPMLEEVEPEDAGMIVPEELFGDVADEFAGDAGVAFEEPPTKAKPKAKKKKRKKKAASLPPPGKLLPMNDDRVQKARQMY